MMKKRKEVADPSKSEAKVARVTTQSDASEDYSHLGSLVTSLTAEPEEAPFFQELYKQFLSNPSRFLLDDDIYPDHFQPNELPQPVEVAAAASTTQAPQIEQARTYTTEQAKLRVSKLLLQSGINAATVKKYCKIEAIINFAEVLDFLAMRNQLTAAAVYRLFRYKDALTGLPRLMYNMVQCDSYQLNDILRLVMQVSNAQLNFTSLNRVIDLLKAKRIFNKPILTNLLTILTKESFNNSEEYFRSILLLDEHNNLLTTIIHHCYHSLTYILEIIKILNDNNIDLNQLSNELLNLLQGPYFNHRDDLAQVKTCLRNLEQARRFTIEDFKLILMTRRKYPSNYSYYIYCEMWSCLKNITDDADSIDEKKWRLALTTIFTEEVNQYDNYLLGLHHFFDLMQTLDLFDDEFLPYCSYRATRFLPLYCEWILEDREKAESRFRMVLDKSAKCESNVNINALIQFRSDWRILYIEPLENDFNMIGEISRFLSLTFKHRLERRTIHALCAEPERMSSLIRIFTSLDARDAWSNDPNLHARQSSSLVESSLHCKSQHLRKVAAACSLLERHAFQGHSFIKKVDQMLQANSIKPLFKKLVLKRHAEGIERSYIQNALAFCMTVHICFQWQRQTPEINHYFVMDHILPWLYITEFPNIDERKALASLLSFPCEPVETHHQTYRWADYSIAFFKKDKAASPTGKGIHEILRR